MQNGSQPSYRFSARGSLPLLDLRRGRIRGALVVDPADLQVVAFLAALEREFHVGVLGDPAAPVRGEYVLAVMFERKLLDEVRRDEFAFGILDEAGIHRVLDQRLYFGLLAVGRRANADGRCHDNSPSTG